MSGDDEFRKRAAEAQDWADKAKSEEDRAAWLRVVHGWLSLIKNRPTTADESFEERSAAEGTGQERSKGSH